MKRSLLWREFEKKFAIVHANKATLSSAPSVGNDTIK